MRRSSTVDTRLAQSLLLAGISLVLSASQAMAADPFASYLFAYFTGNDKAQEAIRFALSDDGYAYKALNKGNAVIPSASISSTGGIRDPHILRGEDQDYYMVATDMVSANGWNSNRGMVLLKSRNLVDWTSAQVNIPKTFPEYAAADRVWAPQTIWDPTVRKYMVYFAMRLGGSDVDKIYWAYANSAFTALETSPKVLYTYNGKAAIDADIVQKDGTYILFFKTEGNGNGIKSATSQNLTGPYTLRDKYLQPTTNAVEGSCVFKLSDSDTWILMYDMYTSGKYQFATSKDLLNFGLSTRSPSFDFTPRHGTVVPITASEKAALRAKWDPTVGTAPRIPTPRTSATEIANNGGHLHLEGLDPSGRRIPSSGEARK
ncbi:MAG TPA: glycoside hydrolase family 43 protein [Fibrobacteria bacterium]|nr:glycoside hydrolase family 43 protein [Fibrobacteria bacterium]